MKFKDYVNEHCIFENLSNDEITQNKRKRLHDKIKNVKDKINQLKNEEAEGNIHFNNKDVKNVSSKIDKLNKLLIQLQNQYVSL